MTADLSKATPRPWSVDTSFPFEVSTGSWVLAKCQMPNPLRDIDEACANAALIVRAVNLYDELVAALREAHGIIFTQTEDNRDVLGRMDAVLAQVKAQLGEETT